jgi:hypothetical protein
MNVFSVPADLHATIEGIKTILATLAEIRAALSMACTKENDPAEARPGGRLLFSTVMESGN